MVTTRAELTVEDYMALPDDGKRYELIDGELILFPAPIPDHQPVITALMRLIENFVYEFDLGRVFAAATDVVFPGNIVLQPDILFISNARLGIIGTKNIQGAPDLAVEVLSPSTESRDRNIKAEPYWKHGVREYWLVDISRRRIEVLGAGRTGFELLGVYGADDALESPTLSGLSMNVGEAFVYV